MRYSVHGFNQQAASLIRKTIIDKDGKEKTLKIDVKDLTLLQWLMDYSSSGKMPSIEIKATKYYHVSYNKLFADNPCLDCNQRTAFEKLQKLVELNLLKYHYDITVKPQSFYAINEKCFELLNDDTPEDIHNLVNNSQFTQLAKNDTTLQKLHDLAKNGTVKQKTVPSSKICNYPSPLNIDTAPAPAHAEDDIYNNNTCLSLSEKEEINKKENNTENISFGYFSLTKNCPSENENRQDAKAPDGTENEEEAFLMECKSVFGKKSETQNADSEKSVSETIGISNSKPSENAQKAPISNNGKGSVSFIAKTGNLAEKGVCVTSDSSDGATIHMFGKDHNGNDLLFKLDNDSPSVDAKKKSPNKKGKTDKMFFDYDNNVIQNINENDLKKWKEAFPAVDIDLDIKRAEVWLKANPAKRKKNIDAFLTRWFSKSQEKGGSYPSNSNGRHFGNNKDELKSEWADRVLGKVIGKGMKASPEAIAEMKAYEESGEAPF